MIDARAVGPTLGRGGQLARERMEARLSRCDATPAQSHVLLYLNRQGGVATQGEVTAFMKVKPPTANGVLDRMAEKGLIERTVSNTDARQRLIRLTEKGRCQLSILRKAFQDTEQMMLRGLSPEEQDQFCRLLGRIIQNLEEDRKV